MKKYNILTHVLMFFAVICTACSDNYSVIKNGAFFDEAITLTGKKVLVNDLGGVTELKIRLAEKSNNNTQLTLVVDESILKDFNNKKGTEYKVLPPEFYEYNSNPIIAANSIESDPLEIKIKPFSKALEATGLKYAIPVRIEKTNNGIAPIGDESKFVIMVDKVTIAKAFVLNANENIKLKLKELETEESVVMPDFTIEFWMCPTIKSHGLFTSGYGEGNTHEVWFTLFNWDTNDQPGVKMRNTYFNTGVKAKFRKWQHVALTYNGVTGSAKIYINGKMCIERSIAAGHFLFKPWVDGPNPGNSWFGVREYRIWNIERSQAQIENNMQSADPKSEGLIGYWKMNEGIGATFNDCSGHAKEGFVTKNGAISVKGEWVDFRSDNEDIIGK